jgi:cytochrome b-561 domain containing protein 2
MSHAILSMADNNFVTQTLNYRSRVTVHWTLQTAALIVITVGQTCIFVNKNKFGKSHFQTTHSIFGVTTYILTLLSSLGGVFTKYSFQLKHIMKPLLTKTLHSFAGLLTYILAYVTICLGINQFWNNSNDAVIKPIVYILLFITTLYVSIKSFILFASRASDLMKR